MNQNDINRIFTEKVTDLIAQGYQINPATMSGSQGEIGKIDLRKDSEIVRILLTSVSGWNEKPDGIRLMVGRCTDSIRLNRIDALGNTIWNQHLEILFEIEFSKIADDYFTDEETGKAIHAKRCQRWENRRHKVRRDMPDAFKSAALRYVQRQPRMKSCKLSDITRVTRVSHTDCWGHNLEALSYYEIEARGKTFRLPAPCKG